VCVHGAVKEDLPPGRRSLKGERKGRKRQVSGKGWLKGLKF
jgi:hypothetical protein